MHAFDETGVEAEAIAIGGNQIVAVGSAVRVRARAGPQTEIIELPPDVAVVPGFIDSHQHRVGDRHYAGTGDAAALLDEAIRQGWTSINELFVTQQLLDQLDALNGANSLRLRVNAYLALASPQGDVYGDWYLAYEPRSDRSDLLRVAGVKLHVDHGWGLGQPMYTQDQLDELVGTAHAAGWQVALHTVGDEAHGAVLTALEHAGIGAAHRPRIEHVIAVSDSNIELMGRLGAIASVQLNLPGYAVDAPDWSEDILPPGHAHMFRYRDLADAGLHVAGSSDWPWITLAPGDNSPMSLLYQAVTRRAGEREPAGWMRGQELTIDEALRSLTIEGAYATFEEDRKGSLEPGKLADLVVLSADPRAVAIDQVPDIEVLATMIGGKFAYCAEDPCLSVAHPLPLPSEPPPSPSFAGTWTGPYPADGSEQTLVITQDDDQLTAEFSDTYSGDLDPPGYEGMGTGQLVQPYVAEMTFDLERHDGSAVHVEATLTLSMDGQNMTLSFEGSSPAELQRTN